MERIRKDSCGLKVSPDPSPLVAGPVSCDLASHAFVRLPIASLLELRRRPEPVVGPGLPTGFFKHVDEQTIAGVAAVFRAVHEGELDPRSFRDWGVLAAPLYLGQSSMAASWQRFHAEGAWGVSPHVIPHRSLHAMSGTVSHALKIHGPNLGVGGCQGAAADALLAATAMLARGRTPGIWVVLTAMTPDLPLTLAGEVHPEAVAVGLALALLPARLKGGGLRLRVRARPEGSTGLIAGGNGGRFDLFRLCASLDDLTRNGPGTKTQVVSEVEPRVEIGWASEGKTGYADLPARVPAAGPVPTGAEAEL